MYGEGISRTGEIIDIGSELNIIKKADRGTAIKTPD